MNDNDLDTRPRTILALAGGAGFASSAGAPDCSAIAEMRLDIAGATEGPVLSRPLVVLSDSRDPEDSKCLYYRQVRSVWHARARNRWRQLGHLSDLSLEGWSGTLLTCRRVY